MHMDLVVLALLAEADMFPNQVPGFLPTIGAPTFNAGSVPATSDHQQSASRFLPPVQIGDIYQAAKQRAVEDYELDKLFNPDFYGDSI
jgi:hypothetical protein